MRNTFKDSALQKDFEQKGHVEIPVLDSKDIAALLEVVTKHNTEYGQPFHTSHFSTEINYKREVNDVLIKVVFPKLEPFLDNCKPIFGNLMIKQANSDFFMPLHSDWTYVDENRFRSIAVWIPLVDTNEENGCLGVIEGSHKVMGKIRGPGIEVSSRSKDMEWIEKFGKLLPLKAGHAIIYDHALMHYSPPNKSKVVRPALNVSVVPADAEVVHYCTERGGNVIDIYSVAGTEFYLRYNNYQKPEINSLTGTITAETIGWVDEKMENFSNAEKKSFLARFFG